MKTLFVVGLLAFGMLVSLEVKAQSSTNIENRLIELHVKQARVSSVLAAIVARYQIPIGFVRSDLDKGQTMTINVSNRTVSHVLDLIVEQLPLYRWEIANDVINVVPVKGKNEHLERLLSLNIARYAPPRDANRFTLRNTIYDLPEVQQFINTNSLATASRISDYPLMRQDNNGKDLSSSASNLRMILNNIIAKGEPKWWMVFYDERTIAISF